MLNRVVLIGRLATDPELKLTPSGIAVTQFRLAVDRPMSQEARNSGQEKQADFISIVAWRQSAEFAANYLGKGRLVAVEGRLQIREYVTQDGQKRRDAEVVADNLKSLDKPKEMTENGGNYQRHAGREEHGAGRYEDEHAEAAPSRAPAPPPNNRRPAAAAASAPARYTPADDDDVDDPFADN
jgi:single-strand DNA-binding protein